MQKTKKTETVVIKIGTDALKAADGMPDANLLRDLVAEMAGLIHAGHRVILVTSGAVGTGRAISKEFHLDLSDLTETQEKQIAASIGQPDLMAIYKALFKEHGIVAAQVLTEKNHFITNSNGSNGIAATFKRVMRRVFQRRAPNPDIVNYFEGALKLRNFIPIVNENDTAAIRELMFTDNDELTGYIAKLANADRVIFLSSGNGVCVTGEEKDKDNVIPYIDFADPNGEHPKSTAGLNKGGRGGMESKYTVAEDLARLGKWIHVASSRVKGIIGKIMCGEKVGTTLVDSGILSNRPHGPQTRTSNAPTLQS